MLSYRHSYHAGNFADVLKHIVLTEILMHLGKKDKPYTYIETHAGAGLYQLNSPEAVKVGEYLDGIARLSSADFPELEPYFSVINIFNPSELSQYPGSPVFAEYLLRSQDSASLHELHPRDFERLNDYFKPNPQFTVFKQDGYQGMMRLLPPPSRRALVLIDPSYEIKSEYEQVIDEVIKAHRKFATGIYAIWYPVVERKRIQQMESKLIASGIKNVQLFELAVKADSEKRGMTASGMIVINPPWGLYEKMTVLLPKLTQHLQQEVSAFSRCEKLVGE